MKQNPKPSGEMWGSPAVSQDTLSLHLTLPQNVVSFVWRPLWRLPRVLRKVITCMLNAPAPWACSPNLPLRTCFPVSLFLTLQGLKSAVTQPVLKGTSPTGSTVVAVPLPVLFLSPGLFSSVLVTSHRGSPNGPRIVLHSIPCVFLLKQPSLTGRRHISCLLPWHALLGVSALVLWSLHP